MSLSKKLSKMREAYRPPSLKITIEDIVFHFRDLSSEEETYASEYSYLKLAESPKNVELEEKPELYVRSMRTAFYYRIAYIAASIRKLEWVDDQSKHQELDVDVRPNATIDIDGVKEGKFNYFVRVVSDWNSHITTQIYEELQRRRDKFRERVDKVISENADTPPRLHEEDARFRKIEIDEDLAVGEDAAFGQSSFEEPKLDDH